MECIAPQEKKKTVNGAEFWYGHRCGQCMPCRILRREQWTTRILLESTLHPPGHVHFVTLTYANVRLTDKGFPTLSKPDAQQFLKRLRYFGNEVGLFRYNEAGRKVSTLRYFLCGEYGEKSWRPHYHLILFGASSRAAIRIVKTAWPEPTEVVGPFQPMSHESRYLGITGWTEITPLSVERARYVARYTTKKLTQQCSALGGRVAEFALMSRKPGLASASAAAIWASIRHHGMDLVLFDGKQTSPGQTTVPGFVKFMGKWWPLDSYLKEKLSDSAGLTTESDLHRARRLESNYLTTPVGTDFLESVQRLERSLLECEKPRRPTLRAV